MKQLIKIIITLILFSTCIAAAENGLKLTVNTMVANESRFLSLDVDCILGNSINTEQIAVIKRKAKEVEVEVGKMLSGKSMDYFTDKKLLSVIKDDVLISANSKIVSILEIKLAVMCVDSVVVTNLLLQ